MVLGKTLRGRKLSDEEDCVLRQGQTKEKLAVLFELSYVDKKRYEQIESTISIA